MHYPTPKELAKLLSEPILSIYTFMSFVKLTILIALSGILVSPLRSQEDTPEEYFGKLPAPLLYQFLERYVGTWEGTLTILDEAGKTLQSMVVQQEYWWAEVENVKMLKGQTVFSQNGKLSFANSKSFIHEGRLYSVTTQSGGGEKQSNIAKIKKESYQLTWLPMEGEEGKRQATETFIDSGKEQTILIQGFEIYHAQGRDMRLTIQGELRKIDLLWETRTNDFYKGLREF